MEGYTETAAQIGALARLQPGFLGMESAQDDCSLEITISYWKDEESIRTWHQQLDHRVAQKRGKEKWYDAYHVRVAKVERAYSFAN